MSLNKMRNWASHIIMPNDVKDHIANAMELVDFWESAIQDDPNWTLAGLINSVEAGVPYPQGAEAKRAHGRVEAMSKDFSFAFSQEAVEEMQKQLKESNWYEEGGWQRLAPTLFDSLTDQAWKRQDAVQASRYYALHDPAYHASIWLIIWYIWGKGVSIKAADPAVQKVLDEFMKDRENDLIARITGQWELSQVILEDGETFLTFFVDTTSGHVKVSYVISDEIQHVIPKKEDRRRIAYYKRVCSSTDYDFEVGAFTSSGVKTEYWADFNAAAARYEKRRRDERVGIDERTEDGTEHETVSDDFTKKFMHQWKVGARGRRGMPPHYSAIPYVKAFKGFLQDRIVLLIALATFAFKQSVKGNQTAVDRIKSQWDNTVLNRWQSGGQESRRPDRERAPGGRVLIENESAGLEQFDMNTGASNAYQDGRIIRQMIAIAAGETEQDLFKDPSIANLASAHAMAGPQLRMFEWWQTFFGSLLSDVLEFVVEQSLIYGKLNMFTQDGESRDLSVEIDFPPLVTETVGAQISALAQLLNAQATSGKTFVSKERMARYILRALGEQDVDAAIAEIEAIPDRPPARPGSKPAPSPDEKEMTRNLHLPDDVADRMANVKEQLIETLASATYREDN